MVLDGRQEPVSCGGSMQEIAQIMREAGCWTAINLDGGGSTTFVSKPEGSDELQVTSKPSDGYARSVSSTLMIVSTAPSSTAFDHAKIESDYDYATIGSAAHMTASGVSATGNVADLPEGCTWAVSDTTKASIDANTGTFTALANGDVDVLLMHEGKAVGEKTMHIVVPDAVYFTRDAMPADYEATITLPVAAAYKGKSVAINGNDITLSVDPAKAGSCSTAGGFTFTAAPETSGVRVASVIAKLAANETIKGSMTINLFLPGENSFDFDNATAGDRQLAWDREVSNSTTEDNMTYTAIDTSKDMVTTYTFAMDMSQIEIPSKLKDLVFMLPGSDDADASAWNFLLQLAERISVLTEVRPVLKFDTRFDVDLTGLKVMNEYFPMESYEFDESTNTLTIHMRWLDQTQAIDASTANPLCLVSGIKLTPKDGQFDSVDKINVVNSGTVDYKIYLRANALYSFSQKPENQEIYGLYPFTNTFIDANGEEKYEAGGYFESTYINIEDTYTLSHARLNGWKNEGNGYYAYYVNGERLKGIQDVGGYYYDFGKDGLNPGQVKYTGIFTEGGNSHYARLGTIMTSGWHTVGDKTYHCHSDGTAHTAQIKNAATCTKGNWPSYYCTNCKVTERAGDYQMPNGHDWDANHKCKVCGFMGLNLEDSIHGLGTLADPWTSSSVPMYNYNASGVHPYFHVSFDGKTELDWSSGAALNDDGTMKDLLVSWTNHKGIGKAYVNIVGKGDYYGELNLEYHIVPRSVTNLKASDITETSVTLTWDKATGADFYGVYQDVDGSHKALKSLYANTFTVNDLTPGETYSFKILAAGFSTDGENKTYSSARWSNIVTVTMLGGEEPPVDPDDPDQPGTGGGEDPDPDQPGGGEDPDPDQPGTGGEGGGTVTPPAGGGGGGGGSMGGGGGGGSAGGGDLPIDKPDDTPEVEFDVSDCTGGETCPAKHFKDVNAHNWFHHAVDYVYIRGIMNGVAEETFDPNGTTTRAMVWTMLARLAGVDTSTGETWWEAGQKWAMEEGVSDGTNPHNKVTREQLATMLWRYLGEEKSTHSLTAFPDDHKISSWALDAMKWANENKIINGNADGTLKPGNDATRAQVAQMFMNLLSK